MNLIDIYNLDVGEVLENVDLAKYTTYKIHTIGRVLVSPRDISCLKRLIAYIKNNDLKYKIIGNGSNLIFTNKVYDGILIKLDNFNDICFHNNTVTVGAGYNLMKLAIGCSMKGLSGLEFATGIPGSVGGSVFMNAGAYNSDISEVLDYAIVLDNNLNIIKLYNSDFKFSYRYSVMQDNRSFICLSACFKLLYGNKEDIMDLVSKRRERRISSQPLEYPSAGSVFRNPLGDFAGRLVEDIGYKGHSIGGAMVSNKHANFIVNTGNATGSDVKKLIEEIKSKVLEKYNIELKVEQEFVE